VDVFTARGPQAAKEAASSSAYAERCTGGSPISW
jgi:hypothetical protein